MTEVDRAPERTRTYTSAGGEERPRPSWARTLALFVILGAFWLFLSGEITVLNLVMMVLAVSLVIYLNPARPFGPDAYGRPIGAADHPRGIFHTVRYGLWLLYEVITANLDVAYRVLHPRMPIDPALLQFRMGMPSELAQVLVANSITLTPGTVTIELEDGEYVVHALVPGAATPVLSGKLMEMAAPIFRDESHGPPEHLWRHSVRELEPAGWPAEEPAALASAGGGGGAGGAASAGGDRGGPSGGEGRP